MFSTDRNGIDLGDGLMMPASTAGMAEFHGARTPEEKAEFAMTLEALNGPRLKEGRDEHLALAEQYCERTRNPAVRSGWTATRSTPRTFRSIWTITISWCPTPSITGPRGRRTRLLPALLDRLEHPDLRLHGVPVEG